jgi:hypothetical protein
MLPDDRAELLISVNKATIRKSAMPVFREGMAK